VAGPVIKSNDVAQTRAAMRALGIGKIVVTPTDNGWSFSGDGNLAGMVGGALGSLRGSPRFPHREHSASSRLQARVSLRWFDLPDGGCYGRSNANVGFSRDEWPSSI